MTVLAATQTGGSRPSPVLFDRFHGMSAPGSPVPSGMGDELGFTWWEDYLSFATMAANKFVGQGGAHLSYEDTGSTVSQLATYPGGVMSILTDTTDNDEIWVQGGGATGVLGAISDTAGSANRVLTAYEARFRLSQVTSGNMYLGLAEEGAAAADFITDAGAMITTKDLLGFYILEGALTTLKFTFQKASQTAVTVTLSTAIAADTWYKVGFIYDPDAPVTERIKIYLDGVLATTTITATQMAAATFPTDEEMHCIAGVKNSTTAAKGLLVDWQRFSRRLAS